MSNVPKTMWVEPDGDEILIHNGDSNLEGLIATGHLHQYTLTNTIPSPEDLIRAALEAAAKVADVKPRRGKPLSGLHHSGIRDGRNEASRLIRALADDPEAIAAIRKEAEDRT